MQPSRIYDLLPRRASATAVAAALLCVIVLAWLLWRSPAGADPPSPEAPPPADRSRSAEPAMGPETTASAIAGQQGGDESATPAEVPSTAATPAGTQGGDYIRVAVGASLVSLEAAHSPAACDRLCAAALLQMGVGETLLRTVPGSGGLSWRLELGLATRRYEVEPSLQHIDVWLKSRVPTHSRDGTLTADHVAATFNAANAYTNPDTYHPYAAELADYMIDADVLTPWRVRFRLRSFDTRLPGLADLSLGMGVVAGRGGNGLVVGTGPYMVVESSAELLRTVAFVDHPAGGGQDVTTVEWMSVPSNDAREAAVVTGGVEVAQLDVLQRGSLGHGYAFRDGARRIVSISFAGNYWEMYGAATADALSRERDTSRPWVGDPFDEVGHYSEETPSMRSARDVREALALAIDRTGLASGTLRGHADEAHLPFLSAQSPLHPPPFRRVYGDGSRARELLASTGYAANLSVPLWVGTGELNNVIGEAVAEGWRSALGLDVTLDRTPANEYGRDLLSRRATTPGVDMCRMDDLVALPYDWPRGRLLSSYSVGAIGAGQELPYATRAYRSMRAERDRAEAKRLAGDFHAASHYWVNCAGLVEIPIGAAYDTSIVAGWPARAGDWALGGVSALETMDLHGK